MRKLKRTYHLTSDLKYDTIQEAIKELNRIRSFCNREKESEKYKDDELKIMLGASINTMDFLGEMVYDKPKNQGGKKIHKTPYMLWKTSGEHKKVTPYTVVLPHLHILVEGRGARSYSDKLIACWRKKHPNYKYQRKRITEETVSFVREYIINQSTVLRHINY